MKNKIFKTKNINKPVPPIASLLRFTTAGNVDDGKSTLIGRLLYDSKAIFEDQMEAIELSRMRKGEEHINLALLTDGLKAEREQGITIDVAYRYFATPQRKFIIADTPGHIQYTRNMVTGASTADLAVILVDARHGIEEQTIRHSYIATLLQIHHIVICINKMDLVNFSQEVYEQIKNDYKSISEKLEVKDIHFIPISALLGDNVVNKSRNMPWYKGPSLISFLETIQVDDTINLTVPRFPVQYVIRPQSKEFHDYRGYAGMITSGFFNRDEEVLILPSGLTSMIKSIDTYDGKLQTAYAPQSVSITLYDNIDISRGNMLVKPDFLPRISQKLDVMICWFNERPLLLKGKYILRLIAGETRCMINEISFKMNINTLEKDSSDKHIKMNDIARISIKTVQPVFYDSYSINRSTGCLILIDEVTNETVAAGMMI
ncbi:MAG: GTP-binding protein [Bacteroidia bacterium]|nr:GTP-binding protein [Bacteroidia bacterium]